MKKALLAVSFFVLLFFTGCSRAGGEYSKLMVQVLALDKSAGGEYEISLLAYQGGTNAGMLGAGGETNTLELVSAKGESVQAALNNVSRVTGLSPFYDHNNGIVLGEEAAREGVGKVLNSFLQYTKMRPSVDVFVYRGEAKEIMGEPEEGKAKMAQMVHLLAQLGEENGKIARAGMKEILSREISAYQDAYIPVITRQKSPDGEEISTDGTAIFQSGVLKGCLDEAETRGMMFVLNKMKRLVAVIDQATYEFTNCSSKVSVRVESGKPVYDVCVNVSVNLFESGRELDIRHGTRDINAAQTAVENYVRFCIMKSADKTLKTYESDVFLFAQRLRLKDNKYFISLENRWRQEIAEAPIHVRVNADIRRTEADVTFHEK